MTIYSHSQLVEYRDMMDDDIGKRSKADLENYILYFEGVPASRVLMPEAIDECKRGLGTPGTLIITYGVETPTDSAILLAISIGDERAGVLIGYGDAKKETGEAIIRTLGGRLIEVY